MSETSSDTESSCGWTIISNEGSDIETLGSEATVEYGVDLLERPLVVDPEPHDIPASSAVSFGGDDDDALDETLREQSVDETLSASEAGNVPAEKDHATPLSFSDHSDIVTLGDVKENEPAEEEEVAAAHEELYLGTSSSSQYTFTAAETVFAAQQPAATNCSSSEDEAAGSTGNVVRRRRLRKNTTSIMTEPEEEAVESDTSEQEEEEKQQEQENVRPSAPPQGQSSSILNKCILLALVVAVSMGFGHFYGTVQIQERQKTVERIRLNELDGVKDLLQLHLKDQTGDLDDLEEQKIISLLTGVIEKITQEKQELSIKLAYSQTHRDDLEWLLQQKAKESSNVESWQLKLTAENLLLKSSLEREEKSLSTLQEQLKKLRSEVRDLEDVRSGADSLLSENRRLKDQLEEEKQLSQSFHGQRERLTAEAQTLRKKLDKERKVTDELQKELNGLRAGEEAASEAEELQSRLMELEKRLSFEQQRSDLWERLYVETKEERAKGDTESKVKKPKEGMSRKNSTKEFFHHHKEQIKKAKEAVKENLRKFSDSVKSTFRNFKDSASTFINKARGAYKSRSDEKQKKESWQRRSQRPCHTHTSDETFQSDHNTRKSGGKFQEDGSPNAHKATMNGCSGVFDCAYQESMSLFNKAMEPIRADEFHQLLQSFLQQEVDHFHHWQQLEKFINNFFHNGVFIHDRMLFTDFVSGVENYLADMYEYHGLNEDVFENLDDYIYRHFFGEGYSQSYRPSGPFERPETDRKEELRVKQQCKQQRARPRPHSQRKWSRSGRNSDRHMADVKIELGPMPFDPKY
ncbi:hypothetical protein LDENG_00279210 [Lucifuga dentata]|nr:hypothetical protein LDENG_00279210 [Lucifuga dentata]